MTLVYPPLQNLDKCFVHDVPSNCRRISWDAVSFCVPANWELAVYKFMRRNVSRIELEDEYSIRLESEWVRFDEKLTLQKILKRYEDASKPLTLKSDESNDVQDLPDAWHATHFVFRETGNEDGDDDLKIVQHELITAFYLCPESSIFCFFLLHVLPGDREDPREMIRLIASTFQNHGKDPYIPWQLFDIGFKMPRDFILEKTHFDIGTKLMVFTWKLRRFFLWYFSCAEVFLKDGTTPAEWACRHLNGSRLLKAPVFSPAGKDRIAWRRRKPYLFGHREEIATLCYKYDVGCQLLKSDDKLVVWVYQYRKESDLDLLCPNEILGQEKD